MKLEMADRTKKRDKGILEDVLVRIDELIVPVDFVVFDDDKNKEEEPYMLLGRPFMATTKMEINMRDRSVTMMVLGKKLRLNMFSDGLPPLHFSNDANYCFDEDMIK